METVLRANLAALLAEYSLRAEATAAMVGRQALNDNTFFTRLGAGANFTVRTYDRLVQWFSDRWPEGLEWPRDIERPKRLCSGGALPPAGEHERAAQ